jgi:hypothetical protein
MPPIQATLPFVLNDPRFISKWDEYITYRKESRWPKLLSRSTQMQWDALAEVGLDGAIESIDTTIRNGWRGIFPEPAKAVGVQSAKKSAGAFASLGALQLQLKDLNDRIRTVRNPSGQAWPPPLTGERKTQCEELIRQRDAIQARINQFAA